MNTYIIIIAYDTENPLFKFNGVFYNYGKAKFKTHRTISAATLIFKSM